jgi:hypothetical protein
MISRSVSDHGNKVGIAVSMQKGSISMGMGRIDISVSGKGTEEGFRQRLGTAWYQEFCIKILTSCL